MIYLLKIFYSIKKHIQLKIFVIWTLIQAIETNQKLCNWIKGVGTFDIMKSYDLASLSWWKAGLGIQTSAMTIPKL